MSRCVDRTCTDGPREHDDNPQPRWTTPPSLLCQRCAFTLERHLAELPAVLTELRSLLGGSQRGGSDQIARTKGNPPVPLNLAAHDHLTETQAVLVSWVRLVAEERGLRGPDRSDPAVTSGWLLSQLDWCAAQPWVDDLADEARDVYRQAETLARTRPGWHRLPAPCPGCGGLTLGRWDGDDHIGCPCGERWPEDDYLRLVGVLAADLRYTMSAVQAAAHADVEPATFRQWVTRGHVRRVGTVDGQARYSTVDIDGMSRRTA